MVQRVKQLDEPEGDLENTAELPLLDIASYEAQLVSGSSKGNPTELRAAGRVVDESRPQELPVLPPADMLRDIEAWIAAQDARTGAYKRDLAELDAARTDAQARAANLALALEVGQKALYAALCRANDGERAALENGVAARVAESRTAELQAELEAERQKLAIASERAAALTAELAQTHESLAAKARERDEMQQRQSELTRALDERENRATQAEGEIASLRARIAEADLDLAQRAERIAVMQTENDLQQVAANAIAAERDALALQVASVLENAQSNEWKRNVWESMWQEQDSELAETRLLLGRVEAERADFAATTERVCAELAECDNAVAHLKADRALQLTAIEELTAARSREQQSYEISASELRLHGETLATEIKALEARRRDSLEAVTAREEVLAETRAAHAALAETLRNVQSSDAAHAARATELEVLGTNLVHALQAETEATKLANALIEARERELWDERERASALEAELQAAIREATNQSAAAQSTEATLNIHVEQLAASQQLFANSERDAAHQSERLENLQLELAHAKFLAERAEASRRALENELERVRTELQGETERVGALDAAQQKLALELERTRGALDERELQLRRLERHATASAQVLNRIRIGIERGNDKPASQMPEVADDGATLIPLDDSDAPPLTLGRRTTIGRAPESDLCLKDASISRHHAVMVIGPRGAFIEDVRSVNGVTVNRQRIRLARLADGDVIELGARRFRFTTSSARIAHAK